MLIALILPEDAWCVPLRGVRGLVLHDRSRRFGAFNSSLGVCIDHVAEHLKIGAHPCYMVDMLSLSQQVSLTILL